MGTPTRITPALAGKSYVFGPFRPGSWDHPRVGGEKQIGGDNGLDKQGSPPRGRGKGCLESFLATTVRITPAWAGKSMPGDGASGVKPDHPRVGGEKFRLFRPCPIRTGITPAWAGKRKRVSINRNRAKDHPRVGGEKQLRGGLALEQGGSPPRGRGKGVLDADAKACNGITPAWAGKSYKTVSHAYRIEDHPRVGGEKTKKIP